MCPSSPPKHSAVQARSPRVRKTRRRLWIVVPVVLVLSLVASIVVWRWTHGNTPASDPTVTASSTQSGSSPFNAVDSGSASAPGADWQSDQETVGAWLELSWQKAREMRQIVLARNPIDQAGVTDGFLTFGDGSYLQVRLSSASQVTVIPFSPRTLDRLRFTATAMSPGAHNVTISELLATDEHTGDDVVADDAPGGNEAAVASATVSAGAADPRALQDGSSRPGVAGTGGDWVVDKPGGAWVQMNWQHPEELTSVEVVGSTRSSTAVSSATLTFGDGTTLPIGAVLATPDRPTIVGFMPRVTRSVRLTIDGVTGTGPLALGELRLYRRGATPERAPSATSQPPDQAAVPCAGPAAGRPATGLVVRCPTTGSVVNGNVSVQVAVASGYSAVTATIWPADASAPTRDPARVSPDASGAATVPLDVSGVPPGPFTVKFEASGFISEPATVYFQLYRGGGGTPQAVESSTATRDRTLVYDEEFNQPLSISRTGSNADYAAAKPVVDGVQDFGNAIFADPAQGLAGPSVVDNRYLRINVVPSPPGYADPQGLGRTHLGGLLASARPGGSGFSAQYGYFEARMLLPAAPGTWPSFWMLPSDNLVAPQPVVAEIDTLEHYGHNVTGACQSTHEYRNGQDAGVAQCGQRFPTDRAAMTWHTYGASLTPTGITFFIDGQVVATAPQVQGGGSPMFFLLDLALGGGWPVNLTAAQDRAALYVDYVRVYV